MQRQLTGANGFYNLKTDLDNRSCEFKVKKDFDFESKLNEIAANNTHVEGWTKKVN